ncbi:hypothetical protein [Pseudoalteromonas virus vB_PspP-H6/1]|nr:hypothetical protein [Pseudoalteromonas virus vB_PspP-H6/1]
MRKPIGCAIMLLPFLLLFIMQSQEQGFIETLLSWAAAMLILGVFIFGAYLASN